MMFNRRPALVTAGALGTAALALSASGTLSAFTASIQNSNDTAGTGTLVMQETNSDGSVVCNSTTDTTAKAVDAANSTQCSTINKYGGNMNMASSTVAGTVNTTSVSTSIHIKNTGTLAASTFTLTPGACSTTKNTTTGGVNGTATDLCSMVNVKIVSGSTTIYDGAASAMGTTPIDITAKGIAVPTQADIPITITTSINSGADNSYQGLQISQPLTWTFNA